MRADYNPVPVPEPDPIPRPDNNVDCALKHFTNNLNVQFLRINSRDGVNGNFQVSELLSFLNEINLNVGTADGIFGPNTKQAVISYQIITSLTPDGIVGRNTMGVD